MNDGITMLRELADTLADTVEEEAKMVKALEEENERLVKSCDALKAENERLRKSLEECRSIHASMRSDGWYAIGRVLAAALGEAGKLAEIAEGRENPVEFARFVLRQDANALIKRAVDVRNDAGKPEPEPETCVWTELENGRLRGCNGNRFGNELGRSKFCPECGRKVEVRG